MIPNFYAITAFINFLTSLIIAILVILKNRKNPKNIGMFILSSLVSLWSLSYFFWQISTTEQEALFWCRALTAFMIFIPAAFLHFALAFAEILNKRRGLMISVYAVLSGFFLFNFTPYFVRRVEPIMEFKYWPVAEPIFAVFVAIFASCAFYAFYIFIKKYRESTGIAKLQAKYVAFGTIVSLVSGSLNFLPWFGVPFPPLTNALVPVYVILMAYAITRYRLMDLRTVFKHILFYTGVSILVYATFYAIAWLYIILFGNVFSYQGYLAGLVIAPVFSVAVYVGGKLLSDFIDKHFFSSLYNYQETIIKTSQKLNNYTSLNKIIDTIAETIKKTLQPEKFILLLNNDSEKPQFKAIKIIGPNNGHDVSAMLKYEIFSEYFKKNPSILIREELDQMMQDTKDRKEWEAVSYLKERLKQLEIYLCLPLTSGDKLSGVILLGAKTETDSYTQKDIELLEVLSYQSGIAIDNASLYRKIEEKNIYLQELINIKNDFIRIANHQLNTPLSIIRNAYSMIKDGSLTPKKGMVYLENGIERLSQILQDLWDTFELEAKEAKINVAKTDIENLVKDLAKKKREMVITTGKKIKITIENPEFKIPFVLCDPIKITHALSNLLDNAIFYTIKGSITIIYELEKDGYLKISIKDTGVGFIEEDKEKMSQKFFRSKKAISMHTDGSGLGLYISKKLIEENEGKMAFSSEGINKGSIFSLTIPVYK